MIETLLTDRGFWGDLIGFVGFPLTLLGLWFTFDVARKSKNAADLAAASAENARREIAKFDVVSELSSSHTLMDNAKNYLRANQLGFVQLAVVDTRKKIVRVRSGSVILTENHRRTLQSIISLMSQIEERIDEHGSKKEVISDKLIIIKQVSSKMDDLQGLISEVRNDRRN